MSNTRNAIVPSPFGPPQEAKLSDTSISGINVGLNTIVLTANAHGERERRAMIWAVNYAHLCRLTGDNLGKLLGMDRGDVRDALTNPRADVGELVEKVADLRSRFDAQRERLYPSHEYKLVRKAAQFALERRKMVNVIGKWRSGKSWPAWEFYLDNLDRAAWVLVPTGNGLKELVNKEAAALSLGDRPKNSQHTPRIETCLGELGIQVIFYDEGFRLWPNMDRKGRMGKPVRIEHVRSHWDERIPSDVGIVNLTTPQHCQMMEMAIQRHERWAPGQLVGRAVDFFLPDASDPNDIAGVARWWGRHYGRLHGGITLDEEAVPALVKYCQTSEGYLGAMVNAIECTAFLYNSLSRTHVNSYLNDQSRGKASSKLPPGSAE